MSAVIDTIRQQGIVAIVRTPTAEDAARNVATLIGAGLKVVEVSLVTPHALDVIRAAVEEAPVGVFIGVGTALTVEDVRLAVKAGARFVVSPIVREEVIKAALDAGLDTLPGATTPSEAMRAVEWGSTLVKLFPASLWSPAVLREALTALPALQTVPTGGVTLDAAPDWIRAGAVALGIGGALTRAGDPVGVARTLISEIAAARP
jgi:2-dehydro-3-deoxyphosphogluconate aldolase/(4S)-4-hydroxy-2-oxoglutarate aldolase